MISPLARKQSYELEGEGGVIRMREDGLFLIYAQVRTTKGQKRFLIRNYYDNYQFSKVQLNNLVPVAKQSLVPTHLLACCRNFSGLTQMGRPKHCPARLASRTILRMPGTRLTRGLLLELRVAIQLVIWPPKSWPKSWPKSSPSTVK